MAARTKPQKRMSWRDGMIFGAVWSMASVGWIAAITLVITWISSGWDYALFWFGIVLLLGSSLFAAILTITLACEVLNLTTKKSRRDALNYFSWAFLYNSVVGGVAVAIPLSFGILEAEPNLNTNRSEQNGADQSAAAPQLKSD